MSTPCAAPSIEPLKAMLIRTGQTEQFAQFNPSLHQLRLVNGEAAEEKVDLGFSGSKLLERLIKVPGEVVSREELIAYAWPERVVGQGSLNQQIYTLRQILSDEKDREIIQTLPRRGYLFNPQFLLEHSAAPAACAPLPVTAPPALPTQRRRKRGWIAAASASIALVGMTWWNTTPLTQGPLRISLLHPDVASQEQLLGQLQPLLERLSALSHSPQHIALGQAAGLYQLHCLQGQRNHTLAFHPSQLSSLSDQQLLECLQ